ncbi:hypothetical protein [Nocardia sp. A7]
MNIFTPVGRARQRHLGRRGATVGFGSSNPDVPADIGPSISVFGDTMFL